MPRAALLIVIALGLAWSPTAAMVGGAAPASQDIAHTLVMIISSRGSLCTGAALTRDLVLTAAHCVAPAATYRLLPKKGATTMAVRSVSVHPRYEPQSFANNRATADVALVKLPTALPEGFAAARLDHSELPVAAGDRFLVAGFGATTIGSDAGIGLARTASLVATGKPGTLQIRLFDPAAKGDRSGLGACTGDSGGPVFRDADGRLLIIGVVSWSTGPKLTGGCGGLTGVTPLVRYRDWIIQAAGKLGSPLAP